MGHDIYAYRKDDTERHTEVAYLRRSAFDDLGRVIYQALDATDCDCGCSGCARARFFTNEQLSTALLRLPPGEDTERERTFLQICIDLGTDVVICFS